MTRVWSRRYAKRTLRMTSSAIRELLKVTEQPDVISFAGGLPAPEAFPVEEIAEAAQRILRDDGPRALQYSATEGYRPLREWVAAEMRAANVPASIEQVLITTGSQQALDLVGKVFVDPGDELVVETPTYLAALQAFTPYGAQYLSAPSDAHGIRTDAVEPLFARRPKLLYTVPTFQNPSGATLSAARRARLVEMAAAHGIPIVEDEPYRELRFQGRHLSRLISLEARRRGDSSDYRGGVLYASTFSKVLSPGMRVGYVVAPAEVIVKLVQAKQSADLNTATFNQMLVYELAVSGAIERNTKKVARLYAERRDAMLAALREHFPDGASWTQPDGGMFLWVTLPEDIDASELLEEAIAQHVAFVPGAPFHPNGGGANTLRLNFSNAAPERIHEGIARLGRALHARFPSAVPA
jgi:2-aminoadipate transaminase